MVTILYSLILYRLRKNAIRFNKVRINITSRIRYLKINGKKFVLMIVSIISSSAIIALLNCEKLIANFVEIYLNYIQIMRILLLILMSLLTLSTLIYRNEDIKLSKQIPKQKQKQLLTTAV